MMVRLPPLILIILAASMTACQSDYDREVDAARVAVWNATHHDWEKEIPVIELVHAEQLCTKYGPLTGCDMASEQLKDISTSLSSCKNDMRSKLCQRLVELFQKSPLAYLISSSDPVPLPDYPWYWSMPTNMLNVLAGDFGYRREVSAWWWARWQIPILSLLSAFILLFVVSLSVIYEQRQKEMQAKRAAQIRAHQEYEERYQRAERKRIKAEAIARLTVESERFIAEEQRIVAEKLAQAKQSEDLKKEKAIQDKLASEQAETKKLLDAVFSTAAHKRRKHGSPSE